MLLGVLFYVFFFGSFIKISYLCPQKYNFLKERKDYADNTGKRLDDK